MSSQLEQLPPRVRSGSQSPGRGGGGHVAGGWQGGPSLHVKRGGEVLTPQGLAAKLLYSRVVAELR
jgi:hypothetical protein